MGDFFPTPAPTVSPEFPLLGVCLGLLGSVMINTGNNVQALGLHQLVLAQQQLKATARGGGDGHGGSISEEVDPAKSKVWCVGTFIFIAGAVVNFVSYAFAPQSILAALEAIQFVTNIFFGRFVLGAAVSRRMVVGTALTIAGTVGAVVIPTQPPFVTGSTGVAEFTIGELQALYGQPAYLTFLVVIGGAGIFLYRVQASRRIHIASRRLSFGLSFPSRAVSHFKPPPSHRATRRKPRPHRHRHRRGLGARPHARAPNKTERRCRFTTARRSLARSLSRLTPHRRARRCGRRRTSARSRSRAMARTAASRCGCFPRRTSCRSARTRRSPRCSARSRSCSLRASRKCSARRVLFVVARVRASRRVVRLSRRVAPQSVTSRRVARTLRC